MLTNVKDTGINLLTGTDLMFKCEWKCYWVQVMYIVIIIMIFCVWSHCFWSVSGITFYNINPLSGFISLMLNITPCKAVVWPFSLLEQSWRTTDCKFWNDLCSKLIQPKLSNSLDGIEIGNEESPLHWKGRGYTPENVACWNRTGEGVRN